MNLHLDRRGLVITAVLLWKLALLVFARLPIPANDSFFYDGAVVNFLLHGEYTNPSLALALPIAGTEVFSAYPPLYQLVLLPWMALFGTSAYAAMWLHFVLFVVYVGGLLALMLRARLPAWCRNVAALFLFCITFHDRPDSLAHALGIWAVFCWAGGGDKARPKYAARWTWAGAVLGILALCTSLQVGGTYLLIGWTWVALRRWAFGTKPLLGPWLLTVIGPPVLIGIVVIGFPLWWNGFLEHATATPSYTGLRFPRVGELLKIGRGVPGILFLTVVLGILLRQPGWRQRIPRERLVQLGAVLLPALLVIGACLFVLTANMVQIAIYLQPLIVGLFLGLGLSVTAPAPDEGRILIKGWRCWTWSVVFGVLALGTAIRAIGISTWGLSCVGDVSYQTARKQVAAEIDSAPDGAVVVFSAAFLYEAAAQNRVRWIHSDWPGPIRWGKPNADRDALLELQPAALVLTQFDYFRRYQPVVAQLASQSNRVDVVIQNSAQVPAPDSIPPLRRVVQHISWAPVIVNLEWH